MKPYDPAIFFLLLPTSRASADKHISSPFYSPVISYNDVDSFNSADSYYGVDSYQSPLVPKVDIDLYGAPAAPAAPVYISADSYGSPEAPVATGYGTGPSYYSYGYTTLPPTTTLAPTTTFPDIVEEDHTLLWLLIALAALVFFWPSLLELDINATNIDSNQFVILRDGRRKKRSVSFELDSKAELDDLVRRYSRALAEEGCVKKLGCQMAKSSRIWGLEYYIQRFVDLLPSGSIQQVVSEAMVASHNDSGCSNFVCDPMKYVNNGNELYNNNGNDLYNNNGNELYY